jgi:hypothetical protein
VQIDQYRDYAPRLSNVGAKSIHEQFLIEGQVDESTQESQIVVTNRDSGQVILEVRRVQSRTYTRRVAKHGKRGALHFRPTISMRLRYSDGVTRIDDVAATPHLYTFTFDGTQFM